MIHAITTSLDIHFFSFILLCLIDKSFTFISDIFSYVFFNQLITVNQTGLLWNKCRMKKMRVQWLGNTIGDAIARKQGALKSIVNAFKLTSSVLKIANVWTARILKDVRRG